jgi:hypothetical protein
VVVAVIAAVLAYGAPMIKISATMRYGNRGQTPDGGGRQFNAYHNRPIGNIRIMQ